LDFVRQLKEKTLGVFFPSAMGEKIWGSASHRDMLKLLPSRGLSGFSLVTGDEPFPKIHFFYVKSSFSPTNLPPCLMVSVL
jgi:hypothetical protein